MKNSWSALGIAGLLVAAPGQTRELSPAERASVESLVAARAPRLRSNALEIWNDAELGYLETKSSSLLQKELTEAGFSVKAGVAGMPTAFVATLRTGAGPTLGILAEFDALPGLSQTADPVKTPVTGRYAGHGCGHNLFGAASVTAAIALARWMKAAHIGGEVRLYGAPAEEGGGGKVFMVRDGLFDSVDAVLHWHPSDQNSAAQVPWLAQVTVNFRFHGKAAHAAAAPEKGRSALDGVESLDYMVNMMREHVPQETRIHYNISNGGAAPNVVPDFAQATYVVRNPDGATMEEIFGRVKKAADGAALGTETTVDVEMISSFKSMLGNDTLGHLVDRTLRRVGGVSYDAGESAWAAKLQQSFAPVDRTPLATAAAVGSYDDWGRPIGSSDVGDVSYVVPTVGFVAATWVPGTPAHSWPAVAASGMSIGIKGATVAARTIALSAAELMVSPDVLAAAKAEFERRRGAAYRYATLIGDMKPPLGYRLGDLKPAGGN